MIIRTFMSFRQVFLMFSLCDSRVIFSAKEGEFVYLVRGGEDGVFVKLKEDNISRKEKL